MATFSTQNYGWAEQDRAALLDYSEDWAEFIIGDDLSVESNWAADSADLVLSNPSVSGNITTIWITGGVGGQVYRVTNTIVTAHGRRDLRYFMLSITDAAAVVSAPVRSALFSRFAAVRQFKNESLAFLDNSFPVDNLSDDTIWDSLITAEADASRALRVFLQPTVVIPETAPQSEIDALVAAGTPFAQESPYDYDPQGWSSDAWGYLVTKNSPIIRVESARFTYPNPGSDILNVPLDWLRLDKQHGHVRFVPTGTLMAFGPLNTYLMTAMSSGRVIPNMIHLRYVAGLENAARDYPDLIKVVKRMAALAILKNAFLPQSGSISADGLSQSSSVDTSKWQESIDHDMDALRDSIHGVRMMVL